MVILKIPNKLKLIKYGKQNYTSVINDRQFLYAFYNSKSADKCSMFLSEYRHIYGKWPFVNKFFETEKVTLNQVDYHKRDSIYDIYKSLYVEDCDLEYVIDISKITNMDIMGISHFDYSIKSNNHIYIKFDACNIMYDNKNINDAEFTFKKCQTLNNSYYNTIQNYYNDNKQEDSDDYYDFNLDSEFNEL